MLVGPYKAAGGENFEIANWEQTSQFIHKAENPLHMFSHDQVSNPTTQENHFVQWNGIRVTTDYVWPMGANVTDSKEHLQSMLDETGAVGAGALLFIYHKVHQMMDFIPLYLANPGFMSVHGDALRATLTHFMSGHVRNDVMYRYQRLLQTSPIMFSTMDWLDEFHQDQIGTKMYRFGIPNAFGYIKPENVDAEMIYEAVTNARQNAAKRLVPPSDPQFIEMYSALLQHEGQDFVQLPEIVQIAMMDWRLAYAYIRAKELSFNDALSVFMTFVVQRGQSGTSNDNYAIIEKVYNDYGPSDQWPTLHNVIMHVNAVTGNKAAKPTEFTAYNTGKSDFAPLDQIQKPSTDYFGKSPVAGGDRSSFI